MLPDNAAGNTPTCVGKTHASTPFGAHLQKHPHVRGEDLRHQPKQIWPGETPPRAWGRRIDFFTSSSPSRNTPTCVGKTITHFPASSLTGKHPHVRGEDRRARRYCHPPAETPPRAWGRPAFIRALSHHLRNTPTCVGKTYCSPLAAEYRRKHPHVRGEDNMSPTRIVMCVETPPRAWGRRCCSAAVIGDIRNTPTCVGKTIHQAKDCGSMKETPPRAWGRQDFDKLRGLVFGNTPTCVGKTPIFSTSGHAL